MNKQFESQFIDFAKQKNAFYEEDLNAIRGYKLAIDADYLLSTLTQSNAIRSLSSGYSSLDSVVQTQIQRTLTLLREKYQIEAVVVLNGLKPTFLSKEEDTLIKSYALWSASPDKLFEQILKQYGSRFYAQEIINATKLVKGCSYFIAPFLATTQLVQFFNDKMVHCAVGSAALLAFHNIDQAVVSLDLVKGTFSFIDREDCGVSAKRIADFAINYGAILNEKVGTATFNKITGSDAFDVPVDKVLVSDGLKHLFLDAAPVLNKERKLHMLGGADYSVDKIGLRFADDVYWHLSQGLLDPRFLEQLQNKNTFDDVVIAPSFLIKEVWNIPEFQNFAGLALSNLLERENQDKDLKSGPFLDYLQKHALVKTAFNSHASPNWNITEKNINSEFDRADQEKVSFQFVLRWLRQEIQSVRQAGAKPGQLLSILTQPDFKDTLPLLKTENELLAFCYFQYLESNQFLSFENNYFYGDILEATGEFEDSILILLEMLRIYFPAGQQIDVPRPYEGFQTRFNLLKEDPQRSEGDAQAIKLLSRVFSLLPSSVSKSGKEHVDFDLAAFQSYAQTLKDRMKFVFQSILYRLFQSSRVETDLARYQKAINQLAFTKKDSSSLGLLMKSLLQRTSFDAPYSGFNGSIYDEFGTTPANLQRDLKNAVRFWKKVNFIKEQLQRKFQDKKPELLNQLDQAHNFFINKLEQFGDSELAELLRD